MRCLHCGKEIDEEEPTMIHGTIRARGNQSVKGFLEEGIDWELADSWDEYIICPYCSEQVPIWGEFQQKWKMDNFKGLFDSWKEKYENIGTLRSHLTEEKFFEWISNQIDSI